MTTMKMIISYNEMIKSSGKRLMWCQDKKRAKEHFHRFISHCQGMGIPVSAYEYDLTVVLHNGTVIFHYNKEVLQGRKFDSIDMNWLIDETDKIDSETYKCLLAKIKRKQNGTSV